MKKRNLFNKICTTVLSFVIASGCMSVCTVYGEELALSGSDCESIYAEWTGSGEYNAYYVKAGTQESVKADSQLIRTDGKGGYRLDIVGLEGNTQYEVTIVPVANGVEDASKAIVFTETPESYDRSGYGAYNTDNCPGAYGINGVADSGANIIYVDNSNKDSVTVDGQKGLETILKNGKKITKPLIIRVLGKIEKPAGLSTGMLRIQNFSKGLTIEGIGTDACLYGWGFDISSNSDVEFRNITYSWNYEDALGFQNTQRIWVHDNTFTIGNQNPATEADKVHGDGSCDLKSFNYATIAYNHFKGTAKTCLIGSSPSKVESRGKLTFHHNFFDGTEQRTPRMRWHDLHLYNNYYKSAGYDVDDGKEHGYGLGVACDSSCFAENNYFENTYRPMITSGQGSENNAMSGNNGGAIKAFGNVFVNCKDYIPGTDYFEAPSKDYVLTENDFKAVKGGYIYNNFDTGSGFYKDAYILETAEQAKETVTQKAGVLYETTLSQLSPDAGEGQGTTPTPDPGTEPDPGTDPEPDVPGTDTGDKDVTIASEYYFDFPGSGSVSTSFGGSNGGGNYFTSSGNMSCSSSASAQVTVDGKTYSYTGVGGFKNNGTITFTTKDKGVLTVISTSGSTTPRKMILTDSKGTEIATVNSGVSGNASVNAINFDKADTYTLTNKGGGEAKLFFIGVDENKDGGTEPDDGKGDGGSGTEPDDGKGDGGSGTEPDDGKGDGGSGTEPDDGKGDGGDDKPETFIFGDVSADGTRDSADAAMILQKVLKSTFKMTIEDKTSDYMKYADVTADGKLQSDDAAMVLQKVLKSTFIMNVEK